MASLKLKLPLMWFTKQTFFLSPFYFFMACSLSYTTRLSLFSSGLILTPTPHLNQA